MNQFLKAKTAGLPRWAWIMILGGALTLGVYLRSRDKGETPGEEEEEISPDESSLAYYEGLEPAGGLAAAGLVGPPPGSVVPVETPMLPEGITDIITSQGESLDTLIGALAEREPPERVETETTTEVIHERDPTESAQGLTGGGAPKRKPHHKPPKKPAHKKTPSKPKQTPPHKRGGAGRNHTHRQRTAVGAGHRAR